MPERINLAPRIRVRKLGPLYLMRVQLQTRTPPLLFATFWGFSHNRTLRRAERYHQIEWSDPFRPHSETVAPPKDD